MPLPLTLRLHRPWLLLSPPECLRLLLNLPLRWRCWRHLLPKFRLLLQIRRQNLPMSRRWWRWSMLHSLSWLLSLLELRPWLLNPLLL